MILDTTLRDGSYVINFGFSAEQTATIAVGLEKAQIPYIEIGHGIGLNASEKGLGTAAHTDEEYAIAAKTNLCHSKWGMFAIPCICDLPHLDMCIDLEMDFIRIGVGVDNHEVAYPFIEKAKKAGMLTCVNFMKSYSRPPHIFEQVARDTIQNGADYIYLVDSAGNLTPETTRQYCERIQDISYGFHGHNNLGLANANAIVAYELGAKIIDTSLQGLGRSAGNTQTEQFIAILQRMDKAKDIDLLHLIDISDKYVRPLIKKAGTDGLDLICGFSGFHSSYMSEVRDIALEFDVDPRCLIIELCKVTLDAAPASELRKIALVLRENGRTLNDISKISMERYFGNEQRDL